MSHRSGRYHWRLAAVAGIALAQMSVAQAGGLFDWLFDARQQPEFYSRPPPSLPYANPAAPAAPIPPGLAITVQPPEVQSVNFCVRLCDGRYFPVERHTNMTPVQACSALCPAAKTKVFHGSEVGQARADNGARYDDLDNAYVYRKQVIENCSCNGKTPFGLAQVDVAADPTLRPGDKIATATGVVKFTGSVAQLRKQMSVATAPEPPSRHRSSRAASR